MLEVQTEYIGTSRNPTKRKRCLLQTPEAQPAAIKALATLSDDWRQLLVACVKKGANPRWQTWERIAGLNRKTTLAQLRDWLLKQGWLCVYEEKRSGDWWAYKLEVLHYQALQAALGLDVGDAAQQLQSALDALNALAYEPLQTAIDSLAEMPKNRALARAQLLLKLHDWQVEERSGTYRDFALFARGHTKALTTTEWQWLDDCCDLTAYQIERHTPLLLIAAHAQLHTKQGVIDLSVFADFAALSPLTLAAVDYIAGNIQCWRLIENRTSFERVAKNRQIDEAIVWLPGYPPSWWRESILRLLSMRPATVHIACDPDPAGIAIAWQVMQLLSLLGIEIRPWQMSVAQLENLANPQALTKHDKQQLGRLLADEHLPLALRNLALHMQQHEQKGEQESYL